MTVNDRWIGGGLIILAVLMFIQTARLEFPVLGSDIGPAVFPQVISFGLLISGLWLLIESLLSVKNKNGSDKKSSDKKGIQNIIVVFVSLIIYVLLLNTLGFIVSTLIFTTFSVWFLSNNKNLKSLFTGLFTAIVLTSIIYLIFRKLLNFILPTFF